MTEDSLPPLGSTSTRRFTSVGRILAALVAAAGVTVLVGWMLDDPLLKGGFSPHGITIKANTGLALLLSGVAVCLTSMGGGTPWRVARILAYAIAAIGGATLIEHATGVDLGIDQLLFHEVPGEFATASPNRMGPPAASSFLALGLALLAATGARPRRALAQSLAVLVCTLALLSLIGFAYEVEELFGIGRLTGISLPTAVALLCLAIGLMCAVPEGPVTRLFAAPTAGGVLLRRMVVPVVLLPIVLGRLRLLGQESGWYSVSFGTALLVLALIVVFAGLVWSSARALHRLELLGERLRAERRGFEERLDLAVLGTNMGMWDVDLADGTAVWSASHFTLLGYPPRAGGSATLEMWFARVHEEDREPVRRALELAREQQHYRSLHRIVRPDTTEVRWLDTLGRMLPGEDGRPRRLLGISFDATDDKRAEERLRASEALLRTATENARVGLVVLDHERRYTFANPAYAELLGLGSAEIVGKRVSEVLGRVFDQVGPRLDRAFAGDRVSYELTLPAHETRGESHLMVTYEPQAHAEGDVRGVVEVVVDVSERRRAMEIERRLKQEREKLLESERAARREAEHASRLKDEFLATVSHELRTPLNAILGWSQLLARRLDPENLQKGIDTITRNARVQAQLIEDLLDMSRIISGKIRLDVRLVDPEKILSSALESIEPMARAKNVRIVRNGAATRGEVVQGDPSRLQQVLWNLLSNAIKFTPSGGKVEVGVQAVDSHVEIVVTDTGKGIKPEFLPHIFERFRQADATTTREHGGLGLGLAIVQHIVELHGGSVYAQSPGEGRGATFVVQLPVAREAARELPDERSEAAESGCATVLGETVDLAGVRVLAVDDERDAREMIMHVLSECHAHVEGVSSADEALARLAEQEFHVLIADIGMPGKDGYTLIRELRAREKETGRTVPAIALTAFARTEDRRRALIEGYHMHLAKPVEPVELLSIVANLAGRLGK